jgi:arsenate reductase
MAEAFANHYAGDKVSASSAGVVESAIHPLTIEVMKEVGIDISDQQSKLLAY